MGQWYEDLPDDGSLFAIKDELPLSLAEVKRLFWTNPRMPMLSGDAELKRAIFDTTRARRLEFLTAEDVVGPTPDRAVDVPLGSSTIRLRVPDPRPETPPGDADDRGELGTGIMGQNGQRDGVGGSDAPGGTGTGNGGTTTAGGGGTAASTGRAKLWLKVQADLEDENGRERMRALLRRLQSIVDDEDLESGIITFDLIGRKDRLGEAVNLAKPMTSSSPRLEDLPD